MHNSSSSVNASSTLSTVNKLAATAVTVPTFEGELPSAANAIISSPTANTSSASPPSVIKATGTVDTA